MILALIANIVLSALVFAAVITLIMRTIRGSRPRTVTLVRRQRPWTSTSAASRMRTPALRGSDR